LALLAWRVPRLRELKSLPAPDSDRHVH
jgi:hypothetical protein